MVVVVGSGVVLVGSDEVGGWFKWLFVLLVGIESYLSIFGYVVQYGFVKDCVGWVFFVGFGIILLGCVEGECLCVLYYGCVLME